MENEQDQNQPTQQGVDDMSQTVQGVGKTAFRGARKLSDMATSRIRKQVESKLKMLGNKGFTKMGLAASLLLAKAALVAFAAGAILASFFVFLFSLLLSILTWSVAFAMLVLFILFIINSGAYVVPPGEDLTYQNIIPPAGGGLLVNCPADSSAITSQLASRIGLGAIENLLPLGIGPRGDGLCIIPTMMVMHWSGGYDNAGGNDSTYNTLVTRNSGQGLACQVATDTNDIYLMQPFYEYSVEFPWCANSWNIYSINNEMAGGCDNCTLSLSECLQSGDTNLRFDASPPHPCSPEVERAVATTCVLMDQYNIPWCQIYGHYQVPDSGGKPDPGKDFLEGYFIPRIRSECPNDPLNFCSGGTSIDPQCQVAIQELPNHIRDRVTGNSWRAECPVTLEDLRYLNVNYWGYDNKIHTDGELIVHRSEASNIASVMRSLCSNRFPINKIKLIDEYYSSGMSASDTLSMEDNNTSAFNCRCPTGENIPCNLAATEHSYGRAIDINPRQNPYTLDGGTPIPNGASYNPTAIGTITTTGVAVDAFSNIGWRWGGYWTNPVDYMHFSYNNY